MDHDMRETRAFKCGLAAKKADFFSRSEVPPLKAANRDASPLKILVILIFKLEFESFQ